mmetsp:Transcript_8260/g.15563  ORF Transcript_8260/g.15563 Transcript_8260/m.15563 type:complete len:234 (-) Transcript_8260:287-988(-)
MHSFVGCFFKEHVDQATVSFHATQRLEVSNDSSNHSWNSSNSFKEDNSLHNFASRDFMVPSSCGVESKSDTLHSTVSKSISNGFRFNMSEFNVQLIVIPFVMVEVIVIFSCTSSGTEDILTAIFISQSSINGLKKVVNRNTFGCITTVVQLTNLKNLRLAKDTFVLAQQLLKFICINLPILIYINGFKFLPKPFNYIWTESAELPFIVRIVSWWYHTRRNSRKESNINRGLYE